MKPTLSNKKRAKIYRRCAHLIFNERELLGCNALETASKNKIYCCPEEYPEFFMFQFKSDGGFWWSARLHDYEERKNYRIIAFLFAEQMATNP